MMPGYIDLLGANEIHTFAIYSTHPRATILDVNFVQQKDSLVFYSSHVRLAHKMI